MEGMSETKKYIIEIEEGKDGVMFCQSGIVSIGLHLKDEERLRGLGIRYAIPYTEPDLEQVRKEAYQQGRKDGKIEGQAETWVCAKKIAFKPEIAECVDDLVRIGFDVGTADGWSEAIELIFEKYSASEAIEKIRKYEQEQEQDGLRQNIQTIVDQCGYTLDEIAAAPAKMKEKS